MADKILVVDDSLTDLTEKRSTSQDLKTKYVSPSDLVNLGDGGYTYTEVAVSSGSILAMGSSPIELLPSPGANKYYEYYGLIEFTHNTTAYTPPANDYAGVLNPDSYSGTIFDLFMTSAQNRVWSFSNDTSEYPETATGLTNSNLLNVKTPIPINDPLVLTTWNSGEFTLGDGTLLAKIWYKTRTFGTEL